MTLSCCIAAILLPGCDEFIAFGSPWWCVFFLGSLFARAADLGSTWFASPRLVNEGNPVARRLGWRGGILLNLVIILLAPMWPMLAVSMTTTSCLVAARNLQSAWLMRHMGEYAYRDWMTDRILGTPAWWLWTSHLSEAILVGIPGVVLMVTAGWRLFPFGIGLGFTGYSAAIAVFSSLALWHRRRMTIAGDRAIKD